MRTLQCPEQDPERHTSGCAVNVIYLREHCCAPMTSSRNYADDDIDDEDSADDVMMVPHAT